MIARKQPEKPFLCRYSLRRMVDISKFCIYLPSFILFFDYFLISLLKSTEEENAMVIS